MKKLTFKDGTSVPFTDNSTINDCETVVTTFAKLDSIREKFTTENLNGGTLDGAEIENVVFQSITASCDTEGNITAHFLSRSKSKEEVLEEQVAELQATIADLTAQLVQ